MPIPIALMAIGMSLFVMKPKRQARAAGVSVRVDGLSRKLGRQLESAVKAGARWALILNDTEGERLTLRDLVTGEQRELALSQVPAALST